MASRYFNLNQSPQEDRDRCKMGLTSLQHFYASRHFDHLPFSVRSFDVCIASLVFMKGTSYCVRGEQGTHAP